ncbi:hypothetical protein V2A60_009783 [Cordyceps javanica]
MDSPGAAKRRTDDETPRAKRVQSSSDRSYSLSEQSSHTRSGRTSPLKADAQAPARSKRPRHARARELGDRTVLWRKRFIGSTTGTRGIYQIVRTLQYLERWVRDVYWPCVRSILEQA